MVIVPIVLFGLTVFGPKIAVFIDPLLHILCFLLLILLLAGLFVELLIFGVVVFGIAWCIALPHRVDQ